MKYPFYVLSHEGMDIYKSIGFDLNGFKLKGIGRRDLCLWARRIQWHDSRLENMELTYLITYSFISHLLKF